MRFKFYLLFLLFNLVVLNSGTVLGASKDIFVGPLMLLLCPKYENTEVLCSDEKDNDKDSFIDCNDFDCTDTDVCGEHSEAGCSDGLDNDKDGFFDCDDFGCDGTDACTP